MKLLNLPIDEIIELYNSGIPSIDIAKKMNCSVLTIQRRIKKYGILKPIGHGKKLYKINEKYFDIINNANNAYWLGVFLTDRSTSSNTIRLSFKKEDELHLKKFLIDINSNHPISYQHKEGHTQACISIGNKYMLSQLKRKGIITNDKKVFSVPDLYERDYWRGVIDGDGCLSSDRSELKLVGTLETCSKFKEFCLKHIKTKSKINKIKNKNVYKFSLHGNISYKIAHVLYYDSIISLDRKYKIFNKWENLYKNKHFFNRVVKFFRKKIIHKFNVRRRKITNILDGDCSFKNNEYFIRINNNLNENESVHCLLHELAHIDTMFKQKDFHGSAFGIAYSKIYKMYEKEFTS